MSSVTRLVIQSLGVLSNTLIPYNHGTRLVAHATAKVLTAVDVIEQELEEIFGFFVVPADDAFGIGRVDEEGLFAGDGVDYDDGVDGAVDGTAEDGTVTVVAEFAGDGAGGGVEGLKAFETLTE